MADISNTSIGGITKDSKTAEELKAAPIKSSFATQEKPAPPVEKPKEVSLEDLAHSLAVVIKTLKPKVRDNTVKLAKSVHTLEFGLSFLKDHIKNLKS